MNRDGIVDILTDLTQLDIDAVFAYEQALERIDEEAIYKEIASFRDDHLRHVDDLSELIRKYGGTPPERSRDFKGFFIEGFTAMRSITGTRGALSAMQDNEKTTNTTYKTALAEHPDLPEDALTLLQKNYADEKRHLSFITNALEKWDVEHTA